MAEPLERLTTALHGRYQIERELGLGGMATVYRAVDLKHGRAVAIKVLHPDVRAAVGPERFLQEIRTTAGLQHPNILPLLDSGESAQLVFYVMPLVEGETLRALLDREGRVPVERAVAILREIADALQYAHERGVIHRDIKPENVLLSGGHAVVADFGIARAAGVGGSGRLTGTGMAIGTPAYMSPEQVAGEAGLDHRSDQYSLACVAYELLTGHPPYVGSGAALMARHVVDPVPSLGGAQVNVPKGMAAAVERALAKQASARFESVAAFAAALSQTAHAPDLSIVVLPFANLSPDPDNEYFADGLTDEVITDLSKVRALRVISRNSALQLKGTTKNTATLARELNVRYVLEGGVRRSANALRITAQLVDGVSGTHVWADKYSGTADNIFDLQEQLSRSIVGALAVALTPAEERQLSTRAVRDPKALELLLRARIEMWKMERSSLDLAGRLIDEATAIEGPSATLLAVRGGLIVVYLLLGDPDGPLLAQLEEAAAQAIALDPESADALWLQGLVHIKRAQPAPALRLTQQAVARAPHNPDALFMLGWASWQAGHPGMLGAFRTMTDVDPLNGTAVAMLGCVLAQLGRFEEAVPLFERAIRLSPRAFWLAMVSGFGVAMSGKLAEAADSLEQACRLNPDVPEFGICELLAAGLRGDRAGVERHMTEAICAVGRSDECSSYAIGVAQVQTGDRERAVEWFRNATLVRGWVDYPFWSEREPFLSQLRDDPGYRGVLTEIRRRWESARTVSG